MRTGPCSRPGPRSAWWPTSAQPTFGTGDFLIRSVNGADADRRGVLVGERVPVGTTVQFQVRDAGGAEAELRRSLAELGLRSGRRPPSTGALLFTCTGRGTRFFGEPDHDADLVAAAVGPAVAGMACAGEIGPVAGRNHVHAFTASVLVVRDADRGLSPRRASAATSRSSPTGRDDPGRATPACRGRRRRRR